MGAEKLTSTITELRCSVRFLIEEKLDNVGILWYSKKTLKRNGYLCQVQLSHTPFKAEGIS
jgi:hypothetical protein